MTDPIKEFLRAFKPKPSRDYHHRMRSMPWADEEPPTRRTAWIPSTAAAVVMAVLLGALVVLAAPVEPDGVTEAETPTQANAQGATTTMMETAPTAAPHTASPLPSETIALGIAAEDVEGDIGVPHADVVRFETRIRDGEVLVATFTMADLPHELPAHREGLEEGDLGFEWQISLWWSEPVQGDPDFRMEARYFSGGDTGRPPFLNIGTYGGVNVFPPTAQSSIPQRNMPQVIYDAEANTLTFEARVRPSDITTEAVVTFAVFDALAGTDTPDQP